MARKILLADDSVTAQNMGRRILSDAGYEVITVNNGSAALKKIAEVVPDIIVLDVYMPGYGGLEVCQRLKESQATSRIPVLITVGKLEPFKVEEARRVRADGHIVKPFDATELLAAIMRLEDKIVPQPAVFKGRAAKADAPATRKGREKSLDPGSETSMGWRRRLSIPKNPSPSDANEESKSKARSTAFQDLSRSEEQKPVEAELPETTVTVSNSQEAPTAELAEQKMAEARPLENFDVEPMRLTQVTELSVDAAPKPDQENEKRLEPAVADVSAAATSHETFKAEPGIFEPAVTAVSLPEKTEEPPLVETTTGAQELAPASKSEKTRIENSPSEDEVMAALASLSPMGESIRSVTENATGLAGGLAAVAAVYTGPRWIAEAVPLSDGDAHLILESEMEKAYSAIAAAESAAGAVATVEAEEISASDSLVAAAHEPAGSSTEVPADIKISQPGSQVNAETVQAADSTIAEVGVESAVDSVPEATVRPEVNAVSAAEPAEVTSTDSGEDSSVGFREIAFAAAASAGSQRVEALRPDANLFAVDVPATVTSTEALTGAAILHSEEISETMHASAASPPAVEATTVIEGESELSAAWQNWKQIRESSSPPQTASAEAPDSEFKQIRDEQSHATTKPPAETDLQVAAADAALIVDIVDNVFAELRPKLIEEITKRLAEARK